MRLIDADKLLYDDLKCTDGNTYMIVHAPEIDNAPTAFDLESVIEQFEENKQDMIKAIDENTPSGFYAVSAKDLKAMFEDYTKEQIEILKSAANATNGKNGGGGNGKVTMRKSERQQALMLYEKAQMV